MVDIIQFATAVLTNSSATFILDNEDTRNEIIKLRGKEKEKQENSNLENVANTLRDGNDVNPDDI